MPLYTSPIPPFFAARSALFRALIPPSAFIDARRTSLSLLSKSAYGSSGLFPDPVSVAAPAAFDATAGSIPYFATTIAFAVFAAAAGSLSVPVVSVLNFVVYAVVYSFEPFAPKPSASCSANFAAHARRASSFSK